MQTSCKYNTVSKKARHMNKQ